MENQQICPEGCLRFIYPCTLEYGIRITPCGARDIALYVLSQHPLKGSLS